MTEFWWLLALSASVLSGIMIYANQIFKMPSSLMMSYRGLVHSIILLPLFPFFNMPENPWFWILATVQGLLIAYGDKKLFLCSRIFGGEIAAVIKPYIIAFVFVVWFIIKPSQFFDLLNQPVRFGIIILCIIGVSYSLKTLCQKSAGKEAFIMMLPSLVAFTLIDVNNKYITQLGVTAGLPSAIFYYCWVTGFWCGLPNFLRFIHKRSWKLMFVPKYMAGGALVIFCILFSNICKNTAMFYASNPAYVSAVMSLYPVWIRIWNHFYYRKQNVEKFPASNIIGVAILLSSVITLIFMQ